MKIDVAMDFYKGSLITAPAFDIVAPPLCWIGVAIASE
jgi:hypothetical protein